MSEEEDKQAAWEFELCYEGNPHGDLRYKDKDMRAAFLAGIAHGRKTLNENLAWLKMACEIEIESHEDIKGSNNWERVLANYKEIVDGLDDLLNRLEAKS